MSDGVVVPLRRADDVPSASGEQIEVEWEPSPLAMRVAELIALLERRRRGEFEIDDFGYDAELTDEVLLEPFRWLYRHWFRVQARDVANVPADGGAVVVANHSGTLALDSVMVSLAIHDEHPTGRVLRGLGGDLVFRTPFVGSVARAMGATLACTANADRLLSRGELLGVWPEGYKGVGKRYAERYRVQRFGRGGFVATALRHRAPIVPCAVVGGEETYPLLADVPVLARLFGLPYFPITPTFPWLGPLGAVPLPSRWIIAFGEPIPTHGFGPDAADDAGLVLDLTDQVRETIQAMLPRLLEERGSAFGR